VVQTWRFEVPKPLSFLFDYAVAQKLPDHFFAQRAAIAANAT
jgi:hypothetical protein